MGCSTSSTYVTDDCHFPPDRLEQEDSNVDKPYPTIHKIRTLLVVPPATPSSSERLSLRSNDTGDNTTLNSTNATTNNYGTGSLLSEVSASLFNTNSHDSVDRGSNTQTAKSDALDNNDWVFFDVQCEKPEVENEDAANVELRASNSCSKSIGKNDSGSEWSPSMMATNSGMCHYTHTTFGWSVEYPADWVLMAKDMNTPNSNNGSNSTSVPHGFDVTLRSRRYYKNACIRISGCTSSQAREERHRRHVSEGPHVLSVCRKPYGGAADVLHYLHEVPSEEVGTVRLEGYVFRRGEMMVEVTACVNQEGWDVSAITPAVESILSSFQFNGN